MSEETTERLTVKLAGRDGNAFAILGACSNAMKRAGWTKEDQKRVMGDMRSGNYDHLLQVAMREFDVT